MWDQGVSVVTWFLLRDKARTFQSGLYFRGPSGISSDKPKLGLTAFRFPFVAFREPKTKSVWFWGRSPQGSAAVVVDLQVEDKRRVVTRVRPNRYGISLPNAAGDYGRRIPGRRPPDDRSPPGRGRRDVAGAALAERKRWAQEFLSE